MADLHRPDPEAVLRAVNALEWARARLLVAGSIGLGAFGLVAWTGGLGVFASAVLGSCGQGSGARSQARRLASHVAARLGATVEPSTSDGAGGSSSPRSRCRFP